MPRKSANNGSGTMPDTVTIKAILRSTSPLLFNPATPDLLESLRKKQPMTKRRDISVDEEAEGKLLTNAERRPYVPSIYLYSSLKWAGVHVLFGTRTKVTRATGATFLYSFVYGLPDELILTNGNGGNAEWDSHFCRGRNPADGVMVAIVRPRFKNWQMAVEFHARTKITSTIRVDPSKVRELFEVAGCMIGIGDFRPACGGPFGCFEIAQWGLFGPDGEPITVRPPKPATGEGAAIDDAVESGQLAVVEDGEEAGAGAE